MDDSFNARKVLPGACRRWLLGLLAIAICGLGATVGFALEPATSLANYNHQAWTMENGLPQSTVQSLAQGKDGFLWIGTDAGLARFDGIAFQSFDLNSSPALPGSDIRCLLASRDGALWIGTNAGLVRWKNGAAKVFTAQDGLPDGSILTVWEASEGRVSVWTEQGPATQQGEGFIAVRNVDAYPRTALPSPGEPPSYVFFEEEMPTGVFAMGGRSSLDLYQNGEPVKLLTRLTVGKELPGSRMQSVLADREGGLWIGTNAGLVRWREGTVERFPLTDALAAASILALMEDREGNLWVGTESEGLHILRDQRFHTLDEREGLSSARITAVVEDRAGTLWAGTQGAGLNLLSHGALGKAWQVRRTLTVANGLASNVILSLAAAPNGDLWVGTPDGLNRVRGPSATTFTSADGLPDDFIRSLLVDGDGALWIATRHGLTRWQVHANNHSPADTQMKTYTHADGLGSDLVGAMVRDGRGDLWVATLAGLSRLHGESMTTFTTRDGLPGNVITALLPMASGALLVGTQGEGWALWDGQRFAQPAAARDPVGIHALLDDALGDIWMATSRGIQRCDLHPGRELAASCISFGTADGLRSRETANNSHPSAWRARDGHLWFATPKGLVSIDPAHFPLNTVPPTVAIESFLVDDARQAQTDTVRALRLEAGHVHFEFDYAGLSFVAPLKVRYRYMLEGFDRGWTEAGTRRVAYYTNIPPGRYVFRVQAANNDGVWSTEDAALSFELRPHFYQTLWFYALLLLMAAGAVAVLLRLRLRQAEREFQAVLGERSRIAREIHDTLAQGYVGVSVQLELLTEFLRLNKVEKASQLLDGLRGFVREGLADARQSIWALRTQDATETTLPIQLRRMAEAAEDGKLVAHFSLRGAYRPLPAATEQEILRVAQEAVHNVKKHAAASQLDLSLEYGKTAIELAVSDNGCGGVETPSPTSPSGHYGLKGMAERAGLIGGVFQLQSAPGQGTTIRLSVPAPEFAREPSGEAQ
jgi:signal transduction histidine kinase/ligand-binding sensor domain-containing protein